MISKSPLNLLSIHLLLIWLITLDNEKEIQVTEPHIGGFLFLYIHRKGTGSYF